MLFCVEIILNKFAPMIIFNGKRSNSVKKQFDCRDFYIFFTGKTNIAYNNKQEFKAFIDNIFLKYLPKEHEKTHVLTLVTCKNTHFLYKVHKVNYLFFEPKTMHLIQPLDLTVNKPIKGDIKLSLEEIYVNQYRISKTIYLEPLKK